MFYLEGEGSKKQIGIKKNKSGLKNKQGSNKKQNEKGRKEWSKEGMNPIPPSALLYLNPSYISWGWQVAIFAK